MAKDKFTLDGNKKDNKRKNEDASSESSEVQELQEKVASTEEGIDLDDTHTTDSPAAVLEDEAQKDTPTQENQEELATDITQVTEEKKKSKFNLYKTIRIVCIIGFIIFTGLFINEVLIQPWRIKQAVDLARNLYDKPTDAPTVSAIPTPSPVLTKIPEEAAATPVAQATPIPDPNRDEKGRLLHFQDLLALNEDVKGWLSIPNTDTNIDYVVMQSSTPDYYLDKDINKEYSKAGTLYLDWRSSVESNTQNYVIYGHNMVSTKEKMFHELLVYADQDKGLDFYKEHPLISFDTIYNTGKWKIFAVIITNGSGEKEPLFEYRTSDFKSSSEFLNFVYQLRVRSVLNIDGVDINEYDQLLTLSTCSYEVDRNYRTVIVARKVRDGEDPGVDVEKATYNPTPVYPERYVKKNGVEVPDIYSTFEEALEKDAISWYAPANSTTE